MFLRVHRLENVHRVVFESYYGYDVVPVVEGSDWQNADCVPLQVLGTVGSTRV